MADELSDLTAMTVELLTAFVSNNRVRAEDLATLIQTTHGALLNISSPAAESRLAPPIAPQADVPIPTELESRFRLMMSGGHKSSRTFCAAPWVHFLTLPDGSIIPCCRAKDAVRKEDGSGFNIRRDSPAEIWNGDGYQKLRRSLLEEKEVPHCTDCYEVERDNRSSYRQLFNQNYVDKYAEHTGQTLLNRLVNPGDPLTVAKPIFFDLRLGNICNLKCRMCGPGLSSQIEKDKVATAWIGHSPTEKIGESVNDWPEAVNLMTQLKDFCLDAVRLELIGGEPTLNRGQMELIQDLVDKGISENIELLMITNMTNAQDSVYCRVSKFKNPNVHLSVEAVGKVNDYIRFPGKWQKLSENFKTVRAKYGNISFGVSPTFQAYNILYVCDLFDWCIENDVAFTTGNILSYPPWLSVCVLPYAVRIIAAQKLEYWAQTRPVADNIKADIVALALYLRDENHRATALDTENFVRYTNDLDVTRKQDIRKSLPELYALWVEHYPWDHTAFQHLKSDLRTISSINHVPI